MGDHWMTVSVYFVGRLSAEDVVVPGATAPPPPGGAAQAASAAGGGRGGRGRGAGRGGRGRGAGRGPSAAAAAAPPAPAAPVPLTVTVASLDAQRVIHGVLEEAGSVFDTGAGLSCFTTITEVTFAVHSRRGVVIISLQGRQQVEDFLDERARAAQRGRNLIWLADFIRSQVFGNQNPVSCVEVEQGLLRMLSQGDFSLWPLIRNHSSLVPLCNRPILLQRLYEELVTVVVTTDMRGYKRILGALDIPYGQQHGWKQWHEDVLSPTSTNSRFLKVFYAASSYNRWNPMREVQAFQLLRFHRNPSIHGLEHAVPAGGVDASTVLTPNLPHAALPRKFTPRTAAPTGQAPVAPEFEAWQVGVMHYSAFRPLFLHSLMRAMHLTGHLARVRIRSSTKLATSSREAAGQHLSVCT